jgi:hypothetical protein
MGVRPWGASKIFQKAIAAEIGAQNSFCFRPCWLGPKRTEVRAPEESEMRFRPWPQGTQFALGAVRAFHLGPGS